MNGNLKYFRPQKSNSIENSKFFSPSSVQPKLTIGQPNDKYEQEADAMADKVMRMPQNGPGIQTKCTSCEEENTLQTKSLMLKSEGGGGVATPALSSQLNSSKGGGSPLPSDTEQSMSTAFGTNFSKVRIHTGSSAARMNQGLNARAFTHGSDIYFNQGQYNPASQGGKKLLAHELTHVVQQKGKDNTSIQRKTRRGFDNYGTFRLNDTDCKFVYTQKWFFEFDDSIPKSKRESLMRTGATQVNQVWSGKYPLIPSALTSLLPCPCQEGASVEVNIQYKEGKKEGSGVQVKVLPKAHAQVNPVTGTMKLEHNERENDFDLATHRVGAQYSQQYTIAHEFGHTIDLTDEYNGWSKLFVPGIQGDVVSVMNVGNTIRPRHYQYFGDLLSFKVLGCRFSPNGIRQPERENPVLRSSTLSGLTTFQDGLKFKGPSSKYSFGTNYDLRLSNYRIFGIFYPQIGAIKLWNPDTEKQSDYGLTAGVRLGQIAHPLVFNLRTGVVINPLEPSKSIRLPISVQAGLRTSNYEFGFHYTPVVNLFSPGNVTHLFGVGLRY